MGTQSLTILLAEDDGGHASLVQRNLKRAGIANHIVHVKDGQEALDYVHRTGAYAARAPDGPMLLLLDIKMPRVDGIEVLRAIKAEERTRRVPVVIMTSSQEEKDVAQSYELGVNSYVVKPVDFNAFADIARQSGYYWLAINRTPTP
jgi:two-component system, response regulator